MFPRPTPPPPPPLPTAAPQFAAPVKRATTEAIRGVTLIATVGVVGVIVLNVLPLPAYVSSHAVGLGIAGAACATAVRWVRGGVRRQARSVAASKAKEFGGGLYGIIAAATWIWLEAADLVGEIADAGSPLAWFDSLSLGWLIGQALQSVEFAVRAALWPWTWFSTFGITTAAMVAGAVWGADGLARWLAPKIRARRERKQRLAFAEQTP